MTRAPQPRHPDLPSTLPLAALLLAACAEPAYRAEGNPSSGQQPAVPSKQAPELKNYTEKLPMRGVEFDMVAIPGGSFTMGSGADEKGHKKDEAPQRKVKIKTFWMGRCEVRWDEYELWAYSKKEVDGVTRPTPPYTDMTFGMGHSGYPAICMTQLAAKTYCEWLSKVTGKKYRLPTEAEWEYACRAGTEGPYSFGDPEQIDAYAWHEDNSDETYQKVGTKKPNPWGLHDMHGNVAEWCQDAYGPYPKGEQDNPLVVPKQLYPRVVRGGSWIDPADRLRSAARTPSHEDWKSQDPQIPKSVWYHTDADFVGFRVVREWRPGEPADGSRKGAAKATPPKTGKSGKK